MSMSRFLDDFTASFMGLLLLGTEIMVTGDLNADFLPGSSCPEGRALMDLCNSLNISQLVTQPTRTTDTSLTLIDVALTTNKSFLTRCDINISAVADHCLVAVTFNLKASCIFIRSYKNYNSELFRRDLMCVPFHIFNIFDDFDDQVDVFNKFS